MFSVYFLNRFYVSTHAWKWKFKCKREFEISIVKIGLTKVLQYAIFVQLSFSWIIFAEFCDKSSAVRRIQLSEHVCWKPMEFFLNVLTDFSEFSDEKVIITIKGLQPATQPSLVSETRMLPQHQQYTCDRQDLWIKPNSCFTDYQFPWIGWIQWKFCSI